jgi:hypothetical protein
MAIPTVLLSDDTPSYAEVGRAQQTLSRHGLPARWLGVNNAQRRLLCYAAAILDMQAYIEELEETLGCTDELPDTEED